MKQALVIILSLITFSLSGQYFEENDFHSELEKSAFNQLMSNKVIDDKVFFISTNSANGLDEYESLIFLIRKYSAYFNSKESQFKSEEKFLKHVFHKSQLKLFKKYELYKEMDYFVNEGIFNCISGTAFYAMLLENLGYEYEIIETPYHAFLEIKGESGNVYVFESTDKAFGFISNNKKIEKRKEEFQLETINNEIRGLGLKIDESETNFLRKITLKQLAGLQYYNSGIVEFNNTNYHKASILLKKAAILYPADRIIELKVLSEQLSNSTVQISDLTRP